MFNLGQWLADIFGANGEITLIAILFVVFFIDALIFPTLPEVFFVGALAFDPNSILWATELLITAMVAETAGMILLYQICEKIRIPRRIESLVGKYVNFLIVPDERMVFLNRFIPLLPFTGALASIANWEFKKVVAYNLLGCLIKYGLIAFVGGAIVWLIGPDGGIYTLILVVIMLILSGIYTYFRKKKMEGEHQNEDS